MLKPRVTHFFDEETGSLSYIVGDPTSSACAIIDPVLGFDPVAARTVHHFADRIIDFIQRQHLNVQWILDTHVHADHVSAAAYLYEKLGGQMGIGSRVTEVQKTFAGLFHLDGGFRSDGSQFQRLFEDGEHFLIGSLDARVIHTPGHTPACVCYLIGDALFVGDTLFMPDLGTARCDFPGGDAATLYDSIQRIYQLPDDTRIYVCHDYPGDGREHYHFETSVLEQKTLNQHLRAETPQSEFVTVRETRDKTLDLPRLMLPAVQLNIRGGRLPESEENGVSYLKIPLNRF
ncbi:MBL fold metallo-hydrolase [Pontibacterium granulatum]|uniref:MBL fold metallo-hydrolase n=1 Tax=Pontibacterium granulatum TaxID=2036029 RepID=UPI00249CB5C0|nr:MBL fold metallo-hydrolase [Pontibacterium granulatum]MDI3323732.1 MBL fold metallo-hydrolase [Pontibacterium granulatum]